MADQTLTRVQPLDPARTALLIIDVQNATFAPEMAQSRPWFFEQARDHAVPNIAALAKACRMQGIEVIYTVMESLTQDGRDRSLDYKLSGFNYPKGSHAAQVIDAVAPEGDEIVIPKTSSSLFNSTNFDYVLRNIGITQVLVTGFLTDQCVDQTVRDGADRGYYMVCVEDACATESAERHHWALQLFQGYCRRMTTAQVLGELS